VTYTSWRSAAVALVVFVICFGTSAYPQSPNTASVVVLVADSTGAALPGAEVRAVSDGGLTARASVSSESGSATLPALSVAGVYTISVIKAGFARQDVKDIVLRAGETVTVRVKLVAIGGTNEVTVYGTARGVRNDPELGARLDAAQIEDVPLLGRKLSYLPLLNAAFRQAKGTGDLFMNSVYVVTGAGGRRQADYIVDGATGDEPWGRQTMFLTLPVGAVQEMNVMSRAFSAEFGWTSSTAVNVVTKSGTNVLHGEALFLGRPGGLQSDTFAADLQCPSAIATCRPPMLANNPAAIIPPDIPDSLAQGSIAIGGPLRQDRMQFFLAADATKQDRTAAITSRSCPRAAPLSATTVRRWSTAGSITSCRPPR